MQSCKFHCTKNKSLDDDLKESSFFLTSEEAYNMLVNLYSMVTQLIGQNGRRGALMISIDCNHPDLEEFIEIKNDLNRVTKANISIRVTNEFMEAVKTHSDYTLSFTREATGEVITKTVNAYDIFHKICENNWNMAEPGFLFWDEIEEYNLLSNTKEFKYAGVNPCAEEP